MRKHSIKLSETKFAMWKNVLFSIFVVFILSFSKCSGSGVLVIDNDAGGDDAMAIFIALLYEKYFNGKKVIALTTGNGNTPEFNVNRNNQKILKVAKRQDIPIYRGAESSLVITPSTNAYYGEDGLGDNNDDGTGLVPSEVLSAAESLLDLSKCHEGNLTVVTIGTLTNVALALKLDSTFLERLEHLYVGAGHIYSEKFPNPEFNAQMDVEAYHIVAESATPDKVTMLPFSQTQESLNFTVDWRKNVLGAIDTDIMRAQNKYERVSLIRNTFWAALDPALVSVVLKPDLVEEYQYSKNGIIICGERRGLNTNSFVEKGKANVRIINKVKTEEYRQFLLDVFSAEIQK